MIRSRAPLLLQLAVAIGWCACASGAHYGKEIGPLTQLHHGVRGRVFAIDSRTLFLQDFHYDGEGPAAYFYVGSSKAPSASGAARLRDERGGAGPLRRYRGESITISLPDGKTLRDVKWFSVWCDDFSVNFGDVSIPRDLDYPKPVKVSALRGVHGVSSDPIVVVDAQTLLIPHFSYDGEAPDAKFWVGRGEAPSPQGIRIPDENGKEAPLRKYDRKTIVLTLPGELTVFDIGHFAVWCEAFTVNFGHVALPRHQLANVPPSLKMLGVSPQSRNNELVQASPGASGARERKRRPPTGRVDATTYRPHLRPGTGPLAALSDSLSDHSSLHRRADSYTPTTQQLIELDKDQADHKASQSLQDKDVYQEQILPQNVQNLFKIQPDYQQQNILQQNYLQQSILQPDHTNQQQKDANRQQQLIKTQQQSNQNEYQRQAEQPAEHQQQQRLQQNYQQPIYQQNHHIIQPQQYEIRSENYQQRRSQELYFPGQDFNQQVFYQRPQDEQYIQQRAYEEALLKQQYQQFPQYRLVPYSPQTGRY